MHPDHKEALEARVVRAAEEALADHQYVSAIDVLTGIRLLAPSNVEAWRKGRIDFLERMIQGRPEKISRSIATFHRWAEEKGLQRIETRYVRAARTGPVDLQFTESGDPEIEKSYRAHYVSPDLSERKQQQLQEKLSGPHSPSCFRLSVIPNVRNVARNYQRTASFSWKRIGHCAWPVRNWASLSTSRPAMRP